jgi:furin
MFFFIRNLIFSCLYLHFFNFTVSNQVEVVLKFENNITDQFLNDISLRYKLHFKRKLFDEYYIFDLKDLKLRKKRSNSQASIRNNGLLSKKLKTDPQIKWFEIQKNLIRIKRSISFDYNQLSENEDAEEEEDEEELIANSLVTNHGSDLGQEKFDSFLPESLDERKETPQKTVSNCDTSLIHMNDPEWKNQWYMNEGCFQGSILNITAAWLMGFTGKNVILSVIDDGIEKNNIEIKDNYDPNASFDLNDYDPDPQPRYDPTNENKHGTRCAGEIAGKANNSNCGVGVAFNSRIGGIRLLDGKITDRLEAEALTFNLNYIDIFSASWGPLDDGKTVDGPGVLSRKAFKNGIKFGRNGKGTIYVWAAGNGGRFMDNCNCDGYTSSIYTITIGGVTQAFQMPVYSEKCSSTLASTFSSGYGFESAIITTDLHNGCTKRHTGTSASAPIGAGIIALALEANSNLTWRDVQYLIILTSDPFNLKNNDWQKNGVGKYFSHNFGFGLMNAGKMVDLALKWSLVERQIKCESYFLRIDDIFGIKIIKKKSLNVFQLTVNQICSLNYLEHVVSVITIESGVRGKLKISLISPSKTKSNLLEFRERDSSQSGFKSWSFMTVHYWGERINGVWQLEIINDNDLDVFLKEWYLKLYGVKNLNSV